MKNLWKMAAFMMMALVSVSLTACGSDDDEDEGNGKTITVNEAQLLGTWDLKWEKSWAMENGVRVNFKDFPETYEDEDPERIEFLKDNQMNMYEYINGKWTLNIGNSGTWKLTEGNKLIIKQNEPEEIDEGVYSDTTELFITEIDNNHFVMKHEHTETYNSLTFTEGTYMYMERVK